MTTMMRAELERLGRAHEEETKIRIKFETKVNGLHALHRALEDKYARSIREIHDLEQLDERNVKTVNKQAAELVDLKAERVEFKSQIFQLTQRAKASETEVESREVQVTEQSAKIERLQEQVEEANELIAGREHLLHERGMAEQTLRKENDALKSQVNHLELIVKENRLVNAEYQEVAEAATQKYQEMQVELNSKMRDIVTVESIKKDRDERIAALRADVEKLERQMEDFRETEI